MCRRAALDAVAFEKPPPLKKQVTEFHLVSVAAEQEQICEWSEMAQRKTLLANWCSPSVFKDLTHDPYAD